MQPATVQYSLYTYLKHKLYCHLLIIAAWVCKLPWFNVLEAPTRYD